MKLLFKQRFFSWLDSRPWQVKIPAWPSACFCYTENNPG